jgi:hypothetical protein
MHQPFASSERSERLATKYHQAPGSTASSRNVEPNFGLGVAMRYLLQQWERLTLFLPQPGAPLDNKICELTLNKAILHRKHSLF